MSNIKVEQTQWFSNRTGTIGIVRAKDTITNEIKVYIGTVSGQDPEEDTQRILDWGNKLTGARIQLIGDLFKTN